MVLKLFICIVIVVILYYAIKENKKIGITRIQLSDPQVTKAMKIVHLSDIHNEVFGDNNEDMVKAIQSCNPDVILITGDFLDKRRTDIEKGLLIADSLLPIAPVYMVMGNHEAKIRQWPEYEKQLEQRGFHILNNERVVLENNIEIIGLSDVRVASHKDKNKQKKYLIHQLEHMNIGKNCYTILMSHQPQFFNVYNRYSIELVLSGHAHGGQVRLPVVGGLFSPNQGVLPKYTSGIHDYNGCKMIISRGMGNSLFPLRWNNCPEIIEITISKEGKKDDE